MEAYAKFIAAFADTVTAILGLVALYALIFHRDKISAFMRILAQTLINERIKRIKGTLGKLDHLDWSEKTSRAEILALFGELAGMIKGFARSNEGYSAALDQLNRFVEQVEQISEPKKRRLSQELHSLLDDQAVDAAFALLQTQNGSQNNKSRPEDPR